MKNLCLILVFVLGFVAKLPAADLDVRVRAQMALRHAACACPDAACPCNSALPCNCASSVGKTCDPDCPCDVATIHPKNWTYTCARASAALAQANTLENYQVIPTAAPITTAPPVTVPTVTYYQSAPVYYDQSFAGGSCANGSCGSGAAGGSCANGSCGSGSGSGRFRIFRR